MLLEYLKILVLLFDYFYFSKEQTTDVKRNYQLLQIYMGIFYYLKSFILKNLLQYFRFHQFDYIIFFWYHNFSLVEMNIFLQ